MKIPFSTVHVFGPLDFTDFCTQSSVLYSNPPVKNLIELRIGVH